jgi:hypothetical protein
LVQTGLLLIYQFVDQPRMATVAKTVTGTAISYTETKCATTSTIGATIILVCNLLVLLNGIRLVYTGRTIPNQFNDGKVMGIMVYTMTLLLLVVLLGSLFVNDPRFLFLLHSCSTLLIALSSAVVHTVPKLFQTMEEYSQKSQVSVQDQVKRCKNCGFIDQSIVGGSYAISSTGGPD